MNAIKSRLRNALQDQLSHFPTQAMRIEIDVPIAPQLNWLYANRHLKKTWWVDRDNSIIRAGLGFTDQINENHDHPYTLLTTLLEEKTSVHPDFTYIGGIRFPQKHYLSEEWHLFGYFNFTLPLFEWVKTPTKTVLACNWLPRPFITPREQLQFILTQLESLSFSLPPIPEITSHPTRIDYPNKTEWTHQIHHIQDKIKNNHYKKLVLARKTALHFPEKLDSTQILNALQQHQDLDNQYQFLIQANPHNTFMGISPERLFRRKGAELFTEALAGTQKSTLTSKLTDNATATEEHIWVVKMIEEVMAKLCIPHSEILSQTRVLKLPHVQHLYRPFRATLKPNITDATLLNTLYPTPAVAGYPVDKALDAISALNHFDRGWYSGLVGTWSKDEVHLAVAIRSGLLSQKDFYLYVGAGIVDAADPDTEWKELEDKINAYLEVCNV